MKMRAQVENSEGEHRVTLTTGETSKELEIPPRDSGFGSSASGGELLFLAMATCYCNDIYREAARRGIAVERVEVEVEGDFPADGAPARDVVYRARVTANASQSDIEDLLRHTDTVAEIQNTLRVETPVRLERIEAMVSE
jgi:organic hydroperoxide reductase OsmC/OhrA